MIVFLQLEKVGYCDRISIIFAIVQLDWASTCRNGIVATVAFSYSMAHISLRRLRALSVPLQVVELDKGMSSAHLQLKVIPWSREYHSMLIHDVS